MNRVIEAAEQARLHELLGTNHDPDYYTRTEIRWPSTLSTAERRSSESMGLNLNARRGKNGGNELRKKNRRRFMPETPVRIQRKRTKGWTMPPNTVYVGRPSKWGNPFIVDEKQAVTNRQVAVASFRVLLREAGSWSSVPPNKWPRRNGRLTHIPAQWTTVEDVRRELRGKDLACWCPLDRPCHADVLLEIANA